MFERVGREDDDERDDEPIGDNDAGVTADVSNPELPEVDAALGGSFADRSCEVPELLARFSGLSK